MLLGIPKIFLNFACKNTERSRREVSTYFLLGFLMLVNSNSFRESKMRRAADWDEDFVYYLKKKNKLEIEAKNSSSRCFFRPGGTFCD